MKIFPAVHYTMGGLWCDYERTADGGLVIGSPRNQQTNIPGLFAIGECEYQYHGANRLGANSLVACIFSGPDRGARAWSATLEQPAPGAAAAEQPAVAVRPRGAAAPGRLQGAARARPAADRIPYTLHAELGRLMTEAATVDPP